MDSLFTVHIDGSTYDVGKLIHPWQLPNITNLMFNALMPPVPEKSVKIRHMMLGGKMESGKTSYYNAITLEAFRRYGRENVNPIPVKHIQLAIELMNDKPVQLIMIDDAIRNANSRQSAKQAEDIADFYEIRHIFEKKAQEGLNHGILITIFATQRYKGLDLVFRDGDILVFKTIPTNPDDVKIVQKFIGPRAYDYLKLITRKIYIENLDEWKSYSVVAIPTADRTGTLKLNYVQPFLRFLEPFDIYEKTDAFMFNRETALEKISKKREWKKEANIYFRAIIKGESQTDLANELKVTQSTISRTIQEVRGELSRLGGAEYETFKANQLRNRGLEVRQLGGNSQPDIIATAKDGRRTVYSCKCLDFNRTVQMKADELRPEIHEALKENIPLILSVYNLADHTEQEIPIDVHGPLKTIAINPYRA